MRLRLPSPQSCSTRPSDLGHKRGCGRELMSEVYLPIRYVKLYPDAGKELDESNFEHHEAVLSYPVEQSALVLVDFWNLMWGPEPIVPELGWEAECNLTVLLRDATAAVETAETVSGL